MIVGAEEMAWWAMFLQCKYEDLGSDPQHAMKKLDVYLEPQCWEGGNT